MNAITQIDMAEVTRLTRAGRLTEATALLQTGIGAGAGPKRSAQGEAKAPAANPASHLLDAPGIAPAFRTRLRPRPPSRPARVRAPLPTGATFETRAIRNDAGLLNYKLYVPSTYAQAPVALVVMLHGCTQDPDDFAAGTRMNAFAETHGFLVAYPEQTRAANPSRCWNWFKESDQVRDRGEPSLIADATRAIIADFRVDPERVFVAGLSAGGAAAAILGCTYPDLYAGIGVHSGLACGAATDMPSAFAAMHGGSSRSGGRQRNEARTIVFHGTADRTVNPANADAIVAQAGSQSRAHEIGRGTSTDGVGFQRTIWRDAAGAPALEQWMIDGAGHAWSGGSLDGTFSTPSGPDASREMLRFFRVIS